MATPATDPDTPMASITDSQPQPQEQHSPDTQMQDADDKQQPVESSSSSGQQPQSPPRQPPQPTEATAQQQQSPQSSSQPQHERQPPSSSVDASSAPQPTTSSSASSAPPPPAQAQAQQQQQPPQLQQQQQQQQPPRPRPPPPIPGPRAARFQSLFAESLRRTIGRLNYENFASCYPTLASNAPQVLLSIQKQMATLLEDRCKREFEQIMVNRDVVAKLNELEALMADAARRRNESNDAEPPTPPHLLPPLTILRAHLAPHLAAHHSQLNARLQTTQAHNARLRDEISRQRAEINALLSAVEAAGDDINAANRALGGVVDELADEALAVDAEMAERTM